MLPWLSVLAVGVVVFLGWNLRNRFGADRLDLLTEKRRAGSRIVSRGELVDGNRHLIVAMALTEHTLFYENSDMEASLELQWVREVEYDTRLGTGTAVEGGQVLRLRCYSQCFEFVLANADVARWQAMLPARRDVTVPAPPVAVPLPA